MWHSVLVTLALASVPLCSAWNSTYAACQFPRAQGQQLSGCPAGTLYVSQTDPQAGYGTINGALAALPNDTYVAVPRVQSI